jgi:voltage-gated potassium channel
VAVASAPKTTAPSQSRSGRRPSLVQRMGRFSVLLAALVAGLAIRPFFETYETASAIFSIFLAATLLGSLFALLVEEAGEDVSLRRWRPSPIFLIAGALGLTGMVGRQVALRYPSPSLVLLITFCWVTFLVIVGVSILNRALRTKRVTFDTISAALCVYMLMGLAWAFIFSNIYIFNTQAFSFPPHEAMGHTPVELFHHTVSAFMYYSFVTMSSIGYGDITPVSPPARALSALEGITGQFYVAILVASLVGIRVSQAMQEEADEIRDAADRDQQHL